MILCVMPSKKRQNKRQPMPLKIPLKISVNLGVNILFTITELIELTESVNPLMNVRSKMEKTIK